MIIDLEAHKQMQFVEWDGDGMPRILIYESSAVDGPLKYRSHSYGTFRFGTVSGRGQICQPRDVNRWIACVVFSQIGWTVRNFEASGAENLLRTRCLKNQILVHFQGNCTRNFPNDVFF